ncbi:hypothetical protein [Castellaniella caeni]|uniref:hypothetical protein n=1 Tax=Castellaniella caeni TaxID=266123 RepID=UPI000B0387F8|nr:hypothetical protein [Castellaniella caeni]
MSKPMRLLTTTTACLGLALGLATAPAHAANWSDNFVGYRYSPSYSEPGNPETVTKNVLSFTHVSGYNYGQNFLNIDLLQSSSNDPANGGEKHESSTGGATEVYMTYRHTLSLGKITDTKLAFGPVRDIGLTAGLDLNTKNTAFAPRKRLLVAGPTFSLDVPKGFFDVSLLWGKEWNHCGLGAPICPDANVAFDSQWIVGLAWMIPFQAGAVPLKFQGFANYNSKKGRDYAGVETDPEILMRTSLMADVGKLMFDKKNTLWVGVGYEYWHNKFGNRYDGRGNKKPGIQTTAPTLQMEYHF